MSQAHDFEAPPTPQEAEFLVKRLSSGFTLGDNASATLTPKDDKSLKIATFSLQKYLKEPDFAAEFLQRGGLDSLCDIIKSSNGNTLAYALNSFLSLMEHDSGWESLDIQFVTAIAHIVVHEQLATIGRPATAILYKLVCANDTHNTIHCFGYPTLHKGIESEPSFIPTLVERLQSQDYILCMNSLLLLTAMLKYVTDEYRNDLTIALDQSNIKKNVIRLMNNHPPEELRGILLDYQAAFIQNINATHKIIVSVNNPRHVKMFKEIWSAAKIESADVLGTKKWRKIGFSTEVPQREFGRTGLFGLEEMYFFVKNNQDLFSKLIYEQLHRPEGKSCPFAKASIEVTDLLCSHWNITSNNFIPEFQSLILNFHNVHATTLQLFFRIFHDMEATTYDFSKVSALVRSQLRSALNNEASKDIGEFDRIMFGTPYQVIRDRRLKELEWADDLLGRDAISNIRTRLSKQSYEFLKKQRISCLLEGAWFPCPLANQRMSSISSNSGGSNMSPNANNTQLIAPNMATNMSSGKRWRYYKLSPSKKAIMYGDFSEKIAPVLKNYEKLPHRIELGSVKEIKTIQRYPGMYSSQTLNNASVTLANQVETSSNNSFALYSENSIPLIELHCSSATQAAEWKDGFSMLLDKGFTSKETAEIFHALTEIGVKVKLLQIAGDRVEIPHGAIEVPPVPPGLGSGFFYAIDS